MTGMTLKHIYTLYCSIIFLITGIYSQQVEKPLVFPPYKHSYGIRKAAPRHLFMFFGPRTFFDDPQGLATAKMITRDNPETEHDDDEVVVYGVNSGRHQIIYNTSMWALTLFGSKGEGIGNFSSPKGIACNPEGDVYVADAGNNRIVQLYNPQKKVEWVRAFNGKTPTSPSLSSPSQVALDNNGKVYVTDTGNRRIVVFDSSGSLMQTIPPAHTPLFKDGPTSLAVADGNDYWSYFKGERIIFCADKNGKRIWKISLNGKVIKKVLLPAKQTAFYAAVDYYHNLWFTDIHTHCVHKYDHNLNYITSFGSKGEKDNQFLEPRGITIWKRYGQTFIAEKTGAQYYWIGTSLKNSRIHPIPDRQELVLSTFLTEYSYVSMFARGQNDTIPVFKNKVIYPGLQKTILSTAQSALARKGRLFLQIEPTYSSYTYYRWYHTLVIKE